MGKEKKRGQKGGRNAGLRKYQIRNALSNAGVLSRKEDKKKEFRRANKFVDSVVLIAFGIQVK